MPSHLASGLQLLSMLTFSYLVIHAFKTIYGMSSGSQALSRPGMKPHCSGPASQGPHKPAGKRPLPTETAPEKPTGQAPEEGAMPIP